jgi:hypothetical protein
VSHQVDPTTLFCFIASITHRSCLSTTTQTHSGVLRVEHSIPTLREKPLFLNKSISQPGAFLCTPLPQQLNSRLRRSSLSLDYQLPNSPTLSLTRSLFQSLQCPLSPFIRANNSKESALSPLQPVTPIVLSRATLCSSHTTHCASDSKVVHSPSLLPRACSQHLALSTLQDSNTALSRLYAFRTLAAFGFPLSDFSTLR